MASCLLCGSLLGISRFSNPENDENQAGWAAGWAAIEEFSENASMNKKVGEGHNLD